MRFWKKVRTVMAKLNESDIMDMTIQESGVDEQVVKNVMSTFWNIIDRELKKGNSVNLLGKGRLSLRMRKGGVVHIPPGHSSRLDDYPVLRFQVSKTLARQLKQDYDEGLVVLEDK